LKRSVRRATTETNLGAPSFGAPFVCLGNPLYSFWNEQSRNQKTQRHRGNDQGGKWSL